MYLKFAAGFLISLVIVLIAMPPFIEFLKKLSFRQSVSEYALEDDQKKAGTPIMGGILFIIVPIVVSLILDPGEFLRLENLTVILAFAGYGLIGFIDDYLIAVKKNNEGLTPAQKFGLQLVLAIFFFLMYQSRTDLNIIIPVTHIALPMGILYFVLVLLMFTGSSNAVNLTDGMDGLAAGVSLIALCAYLVIAFRGGRYDLCIFIASLCGALIGYLYYNKKPARVFMGDTGALALGGVLAAIALVTKTEICLILIAGVPVIETLCVIIQQVSVRTVHKRVFRYTPIHYAFRLRGMSEKNIVYMFWIAEAVLACIGLWAALV
ncbi:MAG: phospho-N-acetylmuramoyl-pentapeptide-transferase [Solobacterium sp.]|nr:phospho-N-acetylmuramoyl-pentapeptide-transferase [Solobacterium sp.]